MPGTRLGAKGLGPAPLPRGNPPEDAPPPAARRSPGGAPRPWPSAGLPRRATHPEPCSPTGARRRGEGPGTRALPRGPQQPLLSVWRGWLVAPGGSSPHPAGPLWSSGGAGQGEGGAPRLTASPPPHRSGHASAPDPPLTPGPAGPVTGAGARTLGVWLIPLQGLAADRFPQRAGGGGGGAAPKEGA